MAHFAELDENNVVLQVIVVHNNELKGANGVEYENKGVEFCSSLFGHTNWVQTSYNNNIRKQFAGVGFTYDDVNDIFLNEEKVLLYPHQIKVVENLATNTALPVTTATVLNSYFKGAYWLIEAVFENQVVFLNHTTDLEKNKAIYVSFALK